MCVLVILSHWEGNFGDTELDYLVKTPGLSIVMMHFAVLINKESAG